MLDVLAMERATHLRAGAVGSRSYSARIEAKSGMGGIVVNRRSARGRSSIPTHNHAFVGTERARHRPTSPTTLREHTPGTLCIDTTQRLQPG